jgi:hypothetical protein
LDDVQPLRKHQFAVPTSFVTAGAPILSSPTFGRTWQATREKQMMAAQGATIIVH